MEGALIERMFRFCPCCHRSRWLFSMRADLLAPCPLIKYLPSLLPRPCSHACFALLCSALRAPYLYLQTLSLGEGDAGVEDARLPDWCGSLCVHVQVRGCVSGQLSAVRTWRPTGWVKCRSVIRIGCEHSDHFRSQASVHQSGQSGSYSDTIQTLLSRNFRRRAVLTGPTMGSLERLSPNREALFQGVN